MRQYAGLAVFVLCSILGAQQASDENAGKAAILGKVVDAVNGEPLKKAMVMARAMEKPGTPSIASTDAEGKFAFPDLDAGRYQLYAERNGYARQQHGQRDPNRPGAPLTLKAGQKMTDVLFRMVPAAVITGRIIDEDNEPVANAQVSAVQFRYVQGKRQPIPAGTASTNDLGEYRIFGLPAGRHYVSVNVRGGFNRYAGARLVSGNGEGYITTYYPGVPDIEQAVAVETAPGREMPGIDIKLVPNRVLQVSGIVVDEETGKPARNVMVMAVPRNAGGGGFIARQPTTTFIRDDSGAFSLNGLAPGEYWLGARTNDRENARSGRAALDLTDREVSGARVAIGPGANISGTIRFDGDDEIDLANLRVMLRPANAVIFFGGGSSAVQADGSFKLTGVGQDDYDVAVIGGPDNSYLKSATMKDQDVLLHGIAINSSGIVGELHIVLSGRGGRIQGTVSNDKKEPRPGAQVVLLANTEGRRRPILTKHAVADQYGAYLFQGITPGNYTLYAWDEVEQGAWDDPDFMASYKNDDEGIKVEEGSTLQKDLPLIVSGSR